MKPEVSIDKIRAQAFEIPTDKPEADGTISWNSTTLIVVEAFGGAQVGMGYTYSSASIVDLICHKLASTISGFDALDPQGAWRAMQGAVRNLGREGRHPAHHLFVVRQRQAADRPFAEIYDAGPPGRRSERSLDAG